MYDKNIKEISIFFLLFDCISIDMKIQDYFDGQIEKNVRCKNLFYFKGYCPEI